MHEHAGCKRRYIVDVKGTGDTSVLLILRRKYGNKKKWRKNFDDTFVCLHSTIVLFVCAF